jgi:acetyltransferase EpsM
MKKVVIWGASGHALVVADIVRCSGTLELVGFLDDANPNRQGHSLAGSTVLGGRERLARLRESGDIGIIVAIGDCEVRMRLGDEIAAMGMPLLSVVHPAAVVAQDAQIGAGTVIAAGSVVAPQVKLGRGVIINTSASVDHESVIGDGVHIGPGAHLGGRVSVGARTWVGIGACVRDRVAIGARSIIGAGAVVVKDIPSDVVAFGTPCAVVRERPGASDDARC